jgi:nucleotide-binding universal stress UspA family protein
MRMYSVLFALVVILVAIVMIANAPTLLKTTSFAIPLAGSFVAPIRLIGLLSVVALAGVYSLIWSFSATRFQARSVKDLRKLEDLRTSLDKQEAGRFAALKSDLERQFGTVLERLDRLERSSASNAAPSGNSALGGLAKALPFFGGSGNNAAGSSGANLDGEKTVAGLNARLDRVRDELAADIGQLEDNILRALERFDPDAKIIQADRPAQRRLP